MNPPGGAATQICARQFDRCFFSLPQGVQAKIQRRIDELGANLRGFPHYRMQGVDAFRLRVGDYRIIYQFNVEKHELHLIAVGNRREIYKKPIN
ncbi:MAG: type II toxin-antitoxin system RelE/ParE family toxin [Verrucomicrobiota bacterium]|nr:type II toxin-antitoxin system RelE/ParE family toxin [Verrucomicrobiota bacterium]